MDRTIIIERVGLFMGRPKKTLKSCVAVTAALTTSICARLASYATSSPEIDAIVGKVETLGKDVATWAAMLAVIGCGAMLAINGLMYLTSDDDGVRAQKKRLMKGSLIGLVIAISASAIISALKGYFA